ncbi:hypothetical protein PVAND_001435 [Polypedilum vanderplanki]|uniref:Uncharacterized protein n=1 Tax=Polypedilum vanderplanki TaxID=319348 RepID=A0A9J6BN74_POLVA|nr:hypothetical protein PVAND_001435 [Polypedilum vanderplanki]
MNILVIFGAFCQLKPITNSKSVINLAGINFTIFETFSYFSVTDNPIYNVVAIFMGISQLRLPNESFSHSIWLIFILFCLIIRTCWQSKMFEFMTSNMRKPLPESIDDLKKMNYTIMVVENHLNYNNELLNELEISTVITKADILYKTYIDILEEKLEKKFALLITSEWHHFLNLTFKRSLPILHSEKLQKMIYFNFMKNDIILSQIDEILSSFIQSGIAKNLYDYGLWLIAKPFIEEIEDTRRILSMSDLEFDFVIFLIVLCASFCCFICELFWVNLVNYGKKFLRKFFGLIEFLRILKTIMNVYHDRW